MDQIGVDARRERLVARLLGLVQLGIAQWLFGNIYEAVVKIPERLSEQTAAPQSARTATIRRSAFGPGSPVRYYAPSVPVTAAALVAALAASRGSGTARRWTAVAASCWSAGTAVTAYLIPAVNRKLFFAAEPPPDPERSVLLRRWGRFNVLRVVAAAAALFAADQARSAWSRAERFRSG